MRKPAEGLSTLRGRPASPRGGSTLHHTPSNETTMVPSTHSPYSCLQLDTLAKSWSPVPPACCVTGVADPQNGGPKWTPDSPSHIMFSFWRAQFGDPFWLPFLVPAGPNFWLQKCRKWSPMHSKKMRSETKKTNPPTRKPRSQHLRKPGTS